MHPNGDGLLLALSVKVVIDAVSECDSKSQVHSEISVVAWSNATGTYPVAGLHFVLSSAEISDSFVASISKRAHSVPNPATVGFIRVLS